jgi:hypothetical protein
VRDRRRRRALGEPPADPEDNAPVAWTALLPGLPGPFLTVVREVDEVAAGLGLALGAADRDRLYDLTFGNALRLYGRMEALAGGDYRPDPHLRTVPAPPDRAPGQAPASVAAGSRRGDPLEPGRGLGA